MGNKTLNSLTLPGLQDTYKIPPQAAEYSSSTTYSIDDYCIYQGQLYRCIQSGSNKNPSTQTAYWTATNISSELKTGIQTSHQQIAYVENGTTASTDYHAGSYIYINGYLYRTTQAIATGVTFDFSANGNCEAISGGVLNSVGTEDVIFNTITGVSTDTTVTTTRSVTAYTTLAVLFNTSSSNPSSSRGFVNLPSFELINNAYYPLCIEGTIGWVRIGRKSGTEHQYEFRVISSSFSTLYLVSIVGLRR